MQMGIGGEIKKLVTMAAYLDEDPPSKENIRAMIVADEDHFVTGWEPMSPPALL